MAIKIKYKGNVIGTALNGQTIEIECAGHKFSENLFIESSGQGGGSISTYQLHGKWKFKDELTSPTADIVQEVRFTSNTYSYTKMEIYNISSGVGIDYYAENDDFIEAYSHDRTPKWYTNYQEVNYGKTPQNVSKEYFEYVTANAELVGDSSLPIEVAT